jgi:hypothetical protein
MVDLLYCIPVICCALSVMRGIFVIYDVLGVGSTPVFR